MKKNKYPIKQLTNLDIKHIGSVIGRQPTEFEINFINIVLNSRLENREYLEVLNRLDAGVKRNINNSVSYDDNYDFIIQNGVQILNENRKITIDKVDSRISKYTNDYDCLLENFVIHSTDPLDVEKLITNKQYGRYFIDNFNKILFSTSIGLKDKKSNIQDLTSVNIFKIEFGKRYFKKHLNDLKRSMKILRNENWFISVSAVGWLGLGKSLINLIQEFKHGININKNIPLESIKSLFGRNDKLSVLILVTQDNLLQLTEFCSNNNLNLINIGIFVENPVLVMHANDDPILNLPIEIFDLQFNANTQHFKNSEIELSSETKRANRISKSSYNNQLIKLFNTINKSDTLWNKSANKLTKYDSGYGISSTKFIDQQIIMSQADANRLIDSAPRLSGRMAIASSARRLVCAGAKPKIVTVHNIFPKSNDSSHWRASELMQGQEEAIRELELEIGCRTIDTYDNFWYQNICTIGFQQNLVTDANICIEDEGDFITLLGSHRGELGGSMYGQHIADEMPDVLPTVDLRMESRLQEVVLQGINTNLIKTAINVGAGGISIAVAKSLSVSKEGIGARIHLSRKLKDEELLFGETQGLVVVVLSEEDIMEFERICMTVGVPSTTIGRVTSNNLFAFNDLIKVDVAKLQNLLI